MNESILPELCQQIDIVVIESDSDNKFRLLTSPPRWLDQFYTDVPAPGQKLLLEDRFPYLDNFLVDARHFWNHDSATKNDAVTANESLSRLSSGEWLETGNDGKQYSLEAFAFRLKSRNILSIQNLGQAFKSKVATLQSARENLLSNELLEKEVRKRTRDIRSREEEIAMRLLAAAGFRDKETGAHVRRIGLYSQEMAKALAWDAQQVDDIRIAAPMHDIGKIGIPDNILTKPGKLTTDEFSIMQRHTIIGAQMLGETGIALLDMGAEIAKSHHEKWDGQGYPEGLRGNEIPISARIVALADVYDALVHKRVYKDEMPECDVLRYLQEQSGKHFDPDLVTLFIDILPEIRRVRMDVPEEE